MSTIQMLLITAMAELGVMLPRRKKYQISVINMFLLYLVILIFGFAGAFGAAFFETGHFGGIKYYGTILCVVLAIFPASIWMKMEYMHLMNYAVVQGALGISIMKFNCILHSCCPGKVVFLNNGEMFVFPSQWVEFVVVSTLFIALIVMEQIPRAKHYLFSTFMIVYGVSRYICDTLRADQGNTIPWLPFEIYFGEFCSFVISLIGFVMLIKCVRRNTHIVFSTEIHV